MSSGESLHVRYQGAPLQSGRTYFWKVKTWDATGTTSGWSEPALFTMGLLMPADWRAKWIGYHSASEQDNASAMAKQLLRLDQSKWVWTAGAKPGDQLPGKIFFRTIVRIPADRPLKQATFLLAADDGFQLFINGHLAAQGGSFKVASSPDVTGRLQPGDNAVGVEVTNSGNNPAGLIGRLVVRFTSGEPMVVPIDATWKSSREPGERWSWPDYDAANWQPATVIAAYGDPGYEKHALTSVTLYITESFTFRILDPAAVVHYTSR